MASVQVETARTVDRDRLLAALEQDGFFAWPVDEVVIEVPCDDDADRACDEILHRVENVVAQLGVPFVPLKANGSVFVGPPLA